MIDTKRSRAWSRILVLAVAVACVAALTVHARRYLPFFSDDGFISLRYSKRLLQGHGLTWTDGERVEGYSNLLWVLLCAAGGVLGSSLVAVARTLGLIATGAAIFAMAWAYRDRGIWSCIMGGLTLAASGTVAVWAVGGLEQPLLIGLLAWAWVLTFPALEKQTLVARDAWWPGLLFGLTCWTRPDGLLFGAVACAVLILVRGIDRKSLKFVGVLAAVPASFWLLQTSFRLLYYGDWIPNTARAKIALTSERLIGGWEYVSGSMVPLAPLGCLMLVALHLAVVTRKHRRPVVLLVASILLWLCYVVFIGGDLFPARRHLAPVVLGLAFLSAEVFAWLSSHPVRYRVVPTAAAALLIWVFVRLQLADVENIRAKHERWEWDGQPVGRALKLAFGAERPLLAVDASGSLPYYSELPSLDMLGLNDRYLALHPPPDFGHGYLGHELGDGQYILSRKPDIICFWVPRGENRAHFRSGRELEGTSEFRNNYQAFTLEASRPFPVTSRLWVRKEDGRIGIRRSNARVSVPGFLFSQNAQSVAQLGRANRLGTVVLPNVSARSGAIPLPPGAWRLLIDHDGGPVSVRLHGHADVANNRLEFSLQETQPSVDVEIYVAKGLQARIYEAIFTRI